jgi:hypothetical protein
MNDFASSAIDRATNMIKSKAKEFYNAQIFEHSNTVERKDSAAIAHLGPLVTPIATAFKGMETMIWNNPISNRFDYTLATRGYSKSRLM